jgi:hypothetical protein
MLPELSQTDTFLAASKINIIKTRTTQSNNFNLLAANSAITQHQHSSTTAANNRRIIHQLNGFQVKLRKKNSN